MADLASLQHQEEAAAYRNTSVERRDGAVVSHAFLDAANILKSARLQRMVLQSLQLGRQLKQESESESCLKAVVNPASIPSPSHEKRCREAAA